MTTISQRGREELERAYRLVNEGDHRDLHMYVLMDNGKEAICEIYGGEGNIYMEHPDGHHSEIVRVSEMDEGKFIKQAKEVLEDR